MAESKGIGRDRLERAMDRLFRVGAIERGFLWRDPSEGKDKIGLREPAAHHVPPTFEIPLTPSADLPPTSPLTYPPSSDDHPLTTAHTHPSYYVREGAAPEAAEPFPKDDQPRRHDDKHA